MRLDSSGKRQRYIKKNVKLDQENNKYYIIREMQINIRVRCEMRLTTIKVLISENIL